MKTKGSLVRTIFIGMITIAVVSILLLGTLMVHYEYVNFNRDSKRLRDEFMEEQRATIKNEVDKVIDYIEYMKATQKEGLGDSLKDKADQAYNIAMNIYKENKGAKRLQEIQKMVKDALRPIRFNEGRGYYFATRLDGVVELFADRPEMEGRNLLDMHDTKGKYVIKDMIEIAKNKTEGFYEYTWTKPELKSKDFPKLSYIRLFAPFNWLIGTGEYLDDDENLTQKRILDRIAGIRFGKDGYIFVVTFDGVTLMNDTQRDVIGKNMWELTDPNGVKVIQEERKAVENQEGGFINYVWNKPSEAKPAAKISFIRGIKDWQWMIGAGVYVDEIDKIIFQNRKSLEERVRHQLIKVASLLLFLIGATYLTARYIANRIDKSLIAFSSFFQKAAEESTKIDLKGINFSEFEALALSANGMIKKREQAERSLRENIAERERLEARLRQAQKMEAIGTLAGGIAHDFNNVLLPIMGHAEMLMMGLPSDSHIQYNLQQIYQAGSRAKDMVRQILAFSRKDRQEKNPVRLGQIIADAVSLLRGSLPATIDIQYDIKTKEDKILANPTQIHQVILNLCTNASHAMCEKGGELRIELDDFVFLGSVNMFRHVAPGRYLRLIVRDSGTGIEHDIMGKIFEPYFTTKGPGEGTGMGLAVVHGIVLDHKGDIAVESEPGEGATITILLPVYESIENSENINVQSPVEIKKGNEKILLVDDEKIVVDVLKTMLENLGYQVTARTSSVEAFEAFRNNPHRFDLIITDMTMPNMTGKDLAAEVLAVSPGMPIILCTGFSERMDEESARAMGIKAFIMKPVMIDQLAAVVREVLDREKTVSRN
jgi:signal transduction histidine kinase/nitrogen-specific signal transduction histidine kinase/ActR/RegA family two-component response regulator